MEIGGFLTIKERLSNMFPVGEAEEHCASTAALGQTNLDGCNSQGLATMAQELSLILVFKLE